MVINPTVRQDLTKPEKTEENTTTLAITAEAARAAGLKTVESVPDVRSAVDVLRDWVQPRDVVLLKASRAAKLEQILHLF